ncbi:MAG TPA: PIN domain-containing protein [candidate division WOR-3 bacterium]|uniref:PIN domain-containing protein n=1 Tax=candidate division WOR-3 bacterium TaxID=2052148 RepID=A0A9C9K1D0_UNCW3|nr:PIN domain-containing protein [candidate division WOR-3 bacterium]
MLLVEEINKIKSIFIDTAPIIYYIEAHPEFGPLVKQIMEILSQGRLTVFSSVLTLTEVLVKPVQLGREYLVVEFINFLTNGLCLVEIDPIIAERAGRLKGKYFSLRTLDALQISAALSVNVDAFLTNDKNLTQIEEIRILLLKDYLS